ncbi:hypothetical protein niasHT_012111 [Heterodera trifolii]|uniref:Uncharacterized protein n=1 Tax=Heterodera trifolii TaxID=157864 RepID=A0ABD2LAC0_9BILA
MNFTIQHTSAEEYDEELILPADILHVDEIGPAHRTFVPRPIAQQQQQQQHGGVPQQVVSLQPLPLTPLQWQFGHNATITQIGDDKHQQSEEGTGGDPFHRGNGGQQHQAVHGKQQQQQQPQVLQNRDENQKFWVQSGQQKSRNVGPGQQSKQQIGSNQNHENEAVQRTENQNPRKAGVDHQASQQLGSDRNHENEAVQNDGPDHQASQQLGSDQIHKAVPRTEKQKPESVGHHQQEIIQETHPNDQNHQNQAVQRAEKPDIQPVEQQQKTENQGQKTVQKSVHVVKADQQNGNQLIHRGQSVPTTQPQTKNSTVKILKEQRMQKQGQTEQHENMDDPFHHGQPVTAAQEQKNTNGHERQHEKTEMHKSLTNNDKNGKNSNEKVKDDQSNDDNASEEEEDDESDDQSDQEKASSNHTDQRSDQKLDKKELNGNDQKVHQEEQRSTANEQKIEEKTKRTDQQDMKERKSDQRDQVDEKRGTNNQTTDLHKEGTDHKSDQREQSYEQITDQPNRETDQNMEERKNDLQEKVEENRTANNQTTDQHKESTDQKSEHREQSDEQRSANNQITDQPKREIDQNMQEQKSDLLEKVEVEGPVNKETTDQKNNGPDHKRDQKKNVEVNQQPKQRNDQKINQEDQTEEQRATNEKLLEERNNENDQKIDQNANEKHEHADDHAEGQGPIAAEQLQKITTAPQIQDVQPQQHQRQELQHVVTVKPFATTGYSSQPVQIVHEQNWDKKQQRGRNDLSFHVIKGFSTRGSKLTMPHSTLLIRRKGLREMTVTLLPPKVGEPIGPQINADRERQMAEIAIQERVDLIRKIEKGIQVDTNTEAPLPQWVLPLMSGKMVTLNETENNSEMQQNFTDFAAKNQTEAQKTAENEQQPQHVQAVIDDEHRMQQVQAVTEQATKKQQKSETIVDKKGEQKIENQQHNETEQHNNQPLKIQAVQQQQSVDEHAATIVEGRQENGGDIISNDPMHQILFGEPVTENPVVVAKPKIKGITRQKPAPNFHVVHSLLWPTQVIEEEEIGEKLDSGGGQQQQQQIGAVQQRQGNANQNAIQMGQFIQEIQQNNGTKIGENMTDEGRHENQTKGQENGAVLVEQQQENAIEQSAKLQKTKNVDEQKKRDDQFGRQNRTVQEAPDDQTDQLQLVMSMSRVIKKPMRQLNIKPIENGTELQHGPEIKNAFVDAHISNGSIGNVLGRSRHSNAVAHGVKIAQGNDGPTEEKFNVETMMFPITDENEKPLSSIKKSEENFDKNSREFAESMMSAIEKHMAKTQNGIDINPERNDQIVMANKNLTEKSGRGREKTDLQKNGNYTADKSAAIFTKLNNITDDVNDERKSMTKAKESTADEAERQDKHRKSENDEKNAIKSDDWNVTESQKSLRQIQIGSSRRLVMLRDDVGEAPKRRKNDKKRKGRKKNKKNDGTQNHQPLTTEDIFGTGAVNLPKTEHSQPVKELSEETILDEELPPAPADLPPFDAFPSPPPSSSKRRNTTIGTQLPQLPDYGKPLIKSSNKNSTSKTTKTFKMTTATTSLPSLADEEEHIEEVNEVPEITTEVPRPTSAPSGGRRVPTSNRKRQKLAKAHQPHQHGEEQHYAPPRRVFPLRRGQVPSLAIGQVGGLLPDEETDASPFDAERAERLWHPNQESRRRVNNVESEPAEQQQQPQTTTSINDEEETTTEQIITTTTTPISINPRQNKAERIESRFDAKSPFEKEIRRKPIVDASFPKQQQQQSSDDEENVSNEKQHDEGEKVPKDRDIMQKDGQPLYLPPFNRPMLMPDGRESDTMPYIGETNDFKFEQKDVEQSLVLMDDGATDVAKSSSFDVEDDKKNEFENLASLTSTESSTMETSSVEMLTTSQNAQGQRVRSNRRRISTFTTPSTTTSLSSFPTSTSPELSSTTNGEEFWMTTRSTVVPPYQRVATTPYDIAKFYRMPNGNSRQRETVLTFCSKRAAIRDSANMVIACAGEDGDVWTPLRCPPGTDCLPAADSTFRICCPVAVGKR